METKRLKNIAILILLLLNAFLLFLLIYQEMQGERARQQALDELTALFATEDLLLSADAILAEDTLPLLAIARRMESEAEIAAFLLGESVVAQSEGGGIFGYTSELGTVRFRSGGGFDTVQFKRTVENADEFMRQFCRKFGYEDITGAVADGTGSLTAMRYAVKVPVYGCTVTMTFENGCLVSAAGAHIDLDDAQTESEKPLSCMSALVRFFDYRREAGIVCSEIRSVKCVYQLQSAVSSPRLLPVWVVETDTYAYHVDGVTGEVSRK